MVGRYRKQKVSEELGGWEVVDIVTWNLSSMPLELGCSHNIVAILCRWQYLQPRVPSEQYRLGRRASQRTKIQ